MSKKFGIDGCKVGWLAVWTQGNNYQFGVFKTLEKISQDAPEFDTYLIDIPVGLSSKTRKRTIEATMRKELKGRSSTVFNAPSRDAIYANNYEDACKLNLAIEGKKLSQQTYNIAPKIRETDEFISTQTSIKVIESHPEVCFKHLNGGKILQTKKKTSEGIKERLLILKSLNLKTPQLYEKILSNTYRKHVARDDIVDAICLSVVLEKTNGKLDFLRDENVNDEKNIDIRIGYLSHKNIHLARKH